MATHSSILAWRIFMDRGAWQATVHGVTEGRTQLRIQPSTEQHNVDVAFTSVEKDGLFDKGC